MDGELATTTESTPAPEAVTQEAPATQADTVAEQPSGFDPVEFTPEQKARVDRLYGNMKRYESKAREQEQANQILADRLVELQNHQQQIVNHLQTTDFQDAEARLTQDRAQAWKDGDVDRFNSANDKLMEIKVQKATQALKQPQQQQKPQQNQFENRPISATEALEMSVQKGETPPEDAPVLRAWFSETDQTGTLKRPWVNVSDVRNTDAAKIGAVVFSQTHPVFSTWSLQQKLAEMDRQMGVMPRQAGGQSVLGAGNLTARSKPSNVKLSPDIERTAVMTKFAERPGMTAAQKAALTREDHIGAWQKAMAKNGGRK